MCNNGNKVIKTNDRLKLINEYKPSKRTFGAEVKKLDWIIADFCERSYLFLHRLVQFMGREKNIQFLKVQI